MTQVMKPLAYAIAWLSPYGNAWLRQSDNEELKMMALQFLESFVSKLEEISPNSPTTQDSEPSQVDAQMSATTEISRMFELARLQSLLQNTSQTPSVFNTLRDLSFEPTDMLETFDETDGHVYNLKWWNDKGSIKYPVVYPVVQALFPAQPTQVRAERMFSELKQLLSDLRMMLGKEIIDQIVLLNGNWDVVQDPKFRLNVKKNFNATI